MQVDALRRMRILSAQLLSSSLALAMSTGTLIETFNYPGAAYTVFVRRSMEEGVQCYTRSNTQTAHTRCF